MSSDTRMVADPFSLRLPLDILERNYVVGAFTWTPGLTTKQFLFPHDLVMKNTIWNALKLYRFFRANVKVTIKVNSIPYLQGCLIVCFLPAKKFASGSPPDLRVASGLQSVLLSAGPEQSATITLPYVHPSEWIPTVPSGTQPYGGNMIGALYINELNTLLSTQANVAATCPVTVWASLQNIQATAWISQSKPNKESSSKNSGGLSVKGLATTASKLLRQAPVVGSIWGTFADIINNVAGDLAKPLNDAAPTRVMATSPNPNSAQCNGLTHAETFSLYTNPVVSTEGEFYGMETSHMTLSQLAMRPQLYHQFTFDSSVNTSFNVNVDPDQLPTTVSSLPDYLKFSVGFCRYWRGSLKFLFHFVMPNLYSVRVRFILNYLPGGTVYDDGDVMEKIVDLKGEAWIPISVPFLYQTSAADRYALRDLPIITIALVTPISGSTAPSTPVVYCNVFRAAGEDFAMYQLHGNKDPTTMVQQASLDDKFKVPFDTFEGALQSVSRGVCHSETIGTISDCLRRQSSHEPNAGTFPAATTPNTHGTTTSIAILRDPWNLFPLVFLVLERLSCTLYTFSCRPS